jgi:4-hydroxy 2-oxovalerate aldolase
MTSKAPWVTYRPELKVLDCTIRDGGLINDHHFDDEMVKAVYDTCVAAGIDYMEIGYKNSARLFAKDKFGAWKHSDEKDILRVIGDKEPAIKLSAMADAEKCDYKTQILPADKSPLSMIRVATYVHQIPVAVDMIKDAHDKGYEVMANIMAISAAKDADVEAALEEIAKTPCETIVVVDSFGAMYTEQVEMLVKKYMSYAKPAGKEVGLHMHNNQQLAFANTIEGIIHGANRVDATLMGMGRGAGNCPMELLIGFLRNPKFHIRPIYQCLQDHIVPLQKKMEWGALLAYNISGQLNQHPRDAIKFRSGKKKNNIVEFYDDCVE